MGVDCFGIFMIIVGSIVSHTAILRYIRHWDGMYIGWFIFGIVWIPFNLWREQTMHDSRVRDAIWPIILV
jgi:hypothetical protein